MVKKYIGLGWRVAISLMGAVILICVGEKDPFWVILWGDGINPEFIITFFSCLLTLEFQHRTVKWVDARIPFRCRKPTYYLSRYTLQFVCSFIPTLCFAVLMAACSVRVFMGEDLRNTYYFQYDIYLVGTGILFLQIILGLLHFTWSMQQFEEVLFIFGEEVSLENMTENLTGGTQGQIVEAVRQKLLQIPDELIEEQEQFSEGLHIPLQIEATPKDLRQMEVITRLDWSCIAAFYSEYDCSYLVSWTGKKLLVDASLRNIARFAGDDYFLACRHLIVHHDSIADIAKIGNGQVRLILNPVIHIDTALSRVATQKFKKWYMRD